MMRVLLELCWRYYEELLILGTKFYSTRDIFQHLQASMKHLKQEEIVMLDNKLRFISDQTVSIRILNQSLVHPREFITGVIERSAAAVICVHNQPSTDSQTSEVDKHITNHLVEAGELFGIPSLDNVIFVREG